MTVAELIAELRTHDPDAIVIYYEARDGEWVEYDGVSATTFAKVTPTHSRIITAVSAEGGEGWAKAVKL